MTSDDILFIERGGILVLLCNDILLLHFLFLGHTPNYRNLLVQIGDIIERIVNYFRKKNTSQIVPKSLVQSYPQEPPSSIITIDLNDPFYRAKIDDREAAKRKYEADLKEKNAKEIVYWRDWHLFLKWWVALSLVIHFGFIIWICKNSHPVAVKPDISYRTTL